MRKLLLIGGIILLGIVVWNVGKILSPDAVGMGVGIIFGVLAGVPCTLMIVSTPHRRSDRYYEGYNDGKRDAEDLILNRRPEWAQPQQSTQHATVVVANAPTVVNIDNRAIHNHYTPARPFAIVAPAPALMQHYQCGLCKTVYTSDRCPGCGVDDFGVPLTLEEAKVIQATQRQFRITWEVEQ